ncbi:MAG: hypothetical protein IPG44_00580 [Anaerolineales bacterium]|jgi:hypothetical protein|nr:hypothetical protein [Anaerolineales bacterium]
MKHKSLIAYFLILIALCAAFIVGAKMMGEQGMYLAQGYMLTPALAALITRLFFYEKKFKDANPRFGRSAITENSGWSQWESPRCHTASFWHSARSA